MLYNWYKDSSNMIIYQGTKRQFSEDVINNVIADKLERHFRLNNISGGTIAEERSWLNSLPRMEMVLRESRIPDDCEVALEYQIPTTAKRIDFMVAGKDDDNKKNDNKVTMTAQEVLASLKESLGDSYTSDQAESEELMNSWGFDMSKVESWVSETNASSSLNLDCTLILKVEDDYVEDAAALLQERYDQVCSYARMYSMDLHRVLQGRLFVNDNYVALIIEGQQSDYNASDEDKTNFAATEAAKVDDAWSSIFGSADNNIIIPEDNGDSSFNMNEDIENFESASVLGG